MLKSKTAGELLKSTAVRELYLETDVLKCTFDRNWTVKWPNIRFFFVTRSQEHCPIDAADVVQTRGHSSANVFQAWWPTSSKWLLAIPSEENITVNQFSSPALDMHKQHPHCVDNFIVRWTPITNISNIAFVSFGCPLWSIILPSSLPSSSFSAYCMF